MRYLQDTTFQKLAKNTYFWGMNKSLSALLMSTIFVSVVGFSIPCTLHCLHAKMKMEMCDGDSGEISFCPEKCTHTKTAAPIDAATADALLAQYRLYSIINSSKPSEGIKNSFSETESTTKRGEVYYHSWISDPPVPPPQQLLFTWYLPRFLSIETMPMVWII